ncbi:MAG: META domain-containing protein [Flavobacteriales bacterium]|jgi:heat shock protein HslJ|nr:META domain-containing protein [Flavobacteriales bacterium]
MKHLALAATLLITLSANTCKQGGDMTNLADKKWVFQSLAGKALDLPAGTEAPWLQLAGDQLQGFGGCNSLMGAVKQEGTALNFSKVGSTKKYCEGVQPTENAIMGMLGRVESFKLEKGLLKLIGGGQELAALKAE